MYSQQGFSGYQPSGAGLSDTQTLSEELEKLEQQITLTLQEIDHNFSRAHRIVTTGILPVLEQYAQSSAAVWAGSKFWKTFFEASANVELNKFEESAEDNEFDDGDTFEPINLKRDGFPREGGHEGVNRAERDESEVEDHRVGRASQDEDDEVDGNAEVMVGDENDDDTIGMTDADFQKRNYLGGDLSRVGYQSVANNFSTSDRLQTSPVPIKHEKDRTRNSARALPVLDARFSALDLSDSSPPVDLDPPQPTIRLDLDLDGTFGGGGGRQPHMDESPSVPKFRHPIHYSSQYNPNEAVETDAGLEFEASTPNRQFDASDLVLSSSPLCATPMTTTKPAPPSQDQPSHSQQYRSTQLQNPGNQMPKPSHPPVSAKSQIAGPIMHRVRDRTFRVVATPLKHPTRAYAQGRKTAAPAAASQRPDWMTSGFDSPDSPALAPPTLRAELFEPLLGGGNDIGDLDVVPRPPMPRTPGISVHTPGRRRRFGISTPRERPDASGATGLYSSKRDYNTMNLFDDLLLDEDGDDDATNSAMADSPPKTMQFHVPQSRLLQTPAREASRRIVNDLLFTAGARAAADPDTAKRTGLGPADTNLFGRRGRGGQYSTGTGPGAAANSDGRSAGALDDSLLLDSTFESVLGVVGGDTLSRFANIDPSRRDGSGGTRGGNSAGPSSGGLFSPVPKAPASNPIGSKRSSGHGTAGGDRGRHQHLGMDLNLDLDIDSPIPVKQECHLDLSFTDDEFDKRS